MDRKPLIRGMIFATPLSLALWVALLMGLHEALPAQDRHAIKAEARQMLSATRHDLRETFSPDHQA